ncbi:MAG TPA: hypothetical protein VI981_00740 [Candidatus Paceibacterota bacterium]
MKKMTIDGLARMIEENVIGNMATKDGLKDGLKAVTERLDTIDDRLTKIENNHERRITNLEDDVIRIKAKVAIK